MKMANMDKVFDFMFTKPKDEHNVSTPVFPKKLLPCKLENHVLPNNMHIPFWEDMYGYEESFRMLSLMYIMYTFALYMN